MIIYIVALLVLGGTGFDGDDGIARYERIMIEDIYIAEWLESEDIARDRSRVMDYGC